MESKIDDVPDPQGVDVCELCFGRLTGSGDPAIKPTPVVDSFRVAHRSPCPKGLEADGLDNAFHPTRKRAHIAADLGKAATCCPRQAGTGRPRLAARDQARWIPHA